MDVAAQKKQLYYTLTHCTIEWCWQAFVHQENTVFRWADMSNFNLLESTNQCKLSSLLLTKQFISFLSYYIVSYGTRWVTYTRNKSVCLTTKNNVFKNYLLMFSARGTLLIIIFLVKIHKNHSKLADKLITIKVFFMQKQHSGTFSHFRHILYMYRCTGVADFTFNQTAFGHLGCIKF